MKLKLDLHPIYNDSRAIEASLQAILDEATDKRATEVEIIPGKGSGQLKKAVLRFLDRPEVKARYHRMEKDGDNWGRLFLHFRWERVQAAKAVAGPKETAEYVCFCCGTSVTVGVSAEAAGRGRAGDAGRGVSLLRLSEPAASDAGPGGAGAGPGRVWVRGVTESYRLVHLPSGKVVATVLRADGFWAKGWGVLG